MHWIFVLATQRKKAASWRFSHLALISVTWQQSTLQSVERCCPQCAQKRGRWSSPELFLSLSPSPPTICLSALFMNIQILFLIYFANAESWRLAIQSLHAHREKPKRKQLCVCTDTCMHISKNISEKEIICKFITTAKPTVFSVEDQLWGEKLHSTIKHLLQNTMSNVFDCDSSGSLVFHLLLFHWNCSISAYYTDLESRFVGFCSDRWFTISCKVVLNFPKIFFSSGLFACDQDILCFL